MENKESIPEVQLSVEEENFDDPLNAPVGDKDIPVLGPSKVKILDASMQTKKDKLQLLNLICKHPDKDETISLSKIKFQYGEKLKTATLWLNKDEDGKIQKGSHIAILLDFVGVKTMKELEGKELMTVAESETVNYLVLKAYE